MNLMHEYTVELRISGNDLDPAEITEELGLRSSMVRHAGEAIGSNRAAAVWGYNGSEGDSAPIWQSLEEGLTFVLSKLSNVKPQLERYRNKYEMFWWCGHFQSSFDGGPTLSPSLLKELGEFGAAVFIDNYLSEEGETGT
jgi:hypothetical protein